MSFPRIPRRWRLRTLMVVVAFCAVGLMTYRMYVERAPVYRLIRQLRTGNAQARSQAAMHLFLMGPKAAFAERALTSALDDPDSNVQTQATFALVKIGSRSPRLVRALVAELEKPPPRYFPDMSWRLGHDPVAALKAIRPDAAIIVSLLEKPLRGKDSMGQMRAITVLCAVASWSDPSSPELAEALLARLAAERFGRRRPIAEALARLDHRAQEKAVARLAEDLRDLESARAFEAAVLLLLFADGTRTAVATLLEQVRGGDARCRLIALLLLARYGELATPAAPTLVQLMTERDADRRIPLVLTFDWGESSHPGGGYNLLWQMYPDLGDPGETSVMALCVRALKAMGGAAERRAIGELTAMLQDPDEDDERKRRAIVALGAFGPGAAEPALRAASLNDPSRSVRDGASAALPRIAEDRARR